MFFRRDWELIDKQIGESDAMKCARLGTYRVFPKDEHIQTPVLLTFKCKLTGKIKIEKKYL